MARRIHIHGGPMHDQTLVVPDNLDHFHIKGMKPMDFSEALTQPTRYNELSLTPVPTRTGTYSQVGHKGYWNDFEWDGWKDE